jgi:hypothetical protein
LRRLVAALLLLLAIPSPAFADETVHIVPGSNINLVARDGRIPVTVQNPTSESVTVFVVGTATSFRLEFLEPQELTIPANTSAVAELPVRAIANGPVEVKVWVEIDGKQIGEETTLAVRVNYDIELFLLVSIAVAMFGLIVVGIIRTVVKLARSRGE